MISLKVHGTQFKKDMNNLIKYSSGYLDGIQAGKKQFLVNLGRLTVESLKEFVDLSARMNPEILHHVYEWTRAGEERARLFEINYTVSNLGLSFIPSFTQSQSIKEGSYEPFYNKAKVMESGQPVTIKPKKSKVLKFEIDGETVFTENDVYVENPGGIETVGGFEKTIDLFFNKYFTQSFLSVSGILDYINNPILYKKNLAAGMRSGKSVGYKTGYKWIANAGIGGR